MPVTTRRLAGASTAGLGMFALLVGSASPVQAAPPPPPSLAEARSQLDSLTVASEEDVPGYSRDLFPHWSAVEGNCNAREMVLQRDGDNVEVGGNCYPTSGSWTSPFDGEVTDDPSQASVDHFVPLKEAWDSGAGDWSTSQREEFANDLDTPQLWAVSPSSNSSKGDKDPSEWMPTETGIHCDYTRSWINVKYEWDLTIDPAEEGELEELLDSTC
ncbi:HNH endonuclease family protein [Allosalinactinospora lopnorensis]|uniref:HNH endonuclease family protein n=1 Tax=Allosalinactinospora lopnorensis TaxID=1352348 RepID=UPI000623EEC2|nr:HNH endonuclease family protein [Allosalinactinospora lopnorensis]